MLMHGRRVAFWLKKTEPHPSRDGSYRVCLVTEGEKGYSPMGDPAQGQAPWYWDEETCGKQNADIGNSPHDTAEIITSSMSFAALTCSTE